MAYTQEQYDTLSAAIAQGALIVEYGDKKVQYRTLEDMFAIQNAMATELGIVKKNSNRRYASFNKGLDNG